MKAGVYYKNTDVRVEEIPVPEIGDNDVLIKVKACGICGSDIMEWYRIKKAPLVLGHELTGEVVDVGKNIVHLKKKDRVFAIHHVPCEECIECIKGHQSACKSFQTINNFSPGGFSEYLRVSGKSVYTGIMKIPDEISYEEGTFIEPLGTVLRGQRASEIRPGESVLVIGCGLSGLLHIKCAKALGAGLIIGCDIEDNRLEAAKKFGAEVTLKPDDDFNSLLRQKNNGRLADKIIVCAGSVSALELALNSIERGGTVLIFAVPKPEEMVKVDFNPHWRNDITIKTSYGSTPLDHIQAIDLLKNKRITVDDMITHQLPLTDIQNGFNIACNPSGCLKVLIKLDN
ncbi:MAG: alcohol dehydrogenase catalytic domain-containing protein [Spirochaetia bacterium]|nr:alcohol dehydrogenase catalytic domain-containing protein [Spirochaetia bacterium]